MSTMLEAHRIRIAFGKYAAELGLDQSHEIARSADESDELVIGDLIEYSPYWQDVLQLLERKEIKSTDDALVFLLAGIVASAKKCVVEAYKDSGDLSPDDQDMLAQTRRLVDRATSLGIQVLLKSGADVDEARDKFFTTSIRARVVQEAGISIADALYL